MRSFPTRVTPEELARRRPRLGLIAPASDILIERDFWRLGLAAGVDLCTTRIPLQMPLTAATLARLAEGIGGAVDRLLPEAALDGVVFGCTSGAAVIGSDTVARLVLDRRAGVAVTDPARAAVAALARLGAGRLAFVAPYTADVARRTADIFRAAGVEITDAVCLELQTDAEIAVPGPDHYRSVLDRMDLAGAEAIFLSCTTAQALDAIAPIEQATGLPVVTSNQAAFWHALSLIGQARAIPGFGRLLG